MTQLKLFSSGIEYASFATSYKILKKAWNVISSSHDYEGIVSNVGVGLCWKVCKEQSSDLTIISFEANSDSSNLHGDFVSSSDLERSIFFQFEFLCTKSNPYFSLNSTAVSLFCENAEKLDKLKSQILRFNPWSRLIVTGQGLGGSVASLFAISLLDNIDSSKNRPLCITFGSLLIGDKNLQQAISRSSNWNSCFLNVVSCKDPLPKLFIKNYMPFGTFLFCSDSNSTCFENPYSNLEILLILSQINGLNQGFHSDEYGDLVEKLRRKAVFKDSYVLVGDKSHLDSLAVGISLQLQQALGLTPHMLKEHNIDINVLETKIKRLEEIFIHKKRVLVDPSRKFNYMKGNLAQLEWYKKEAKNHNIGYYDRYKNMSSRVDHDAFAFHMKLTKFWENMVKEVEMKNQKEDAGFRSWLYGGTTYRRMVEPLAIAEYYRGGGTDYVNEERSKHFKNLEEWLKEGPAKAKKELNNTSRKNVEVILTLDSCFWAHVEEAILACKELRVMKVKNVLEMKLVEFEDYVYDLLKNYAVSPEIFLMQSSYMSWWKDYKAIKGFSYTSKLANFMNDAGKIKLYGLGAYDFP